MASSRQWWPVGLNIEEGESSGEEGQDPACKDCKHPFCLSLSAHPGHGGTYSSRQAKTGFFPEGIGLSQRVSLRKWSPTYCCMQLPGWGSVCVDLTACSTAKPLTKYLRGDDHPGALLWYSMPLWAQLDSMCCTTECHCETSDVETVAHGGLGLTPWNFYLRHLQPKAKNLNFVEKWWGKWLANTSQGWPMASPELTSWDRCKGNTRCKKWRF